MYWLNNLMILYWMSYNLMSANGAIVTRVPAKGQWAQLYGTENYKSVYYVANVRRTFADLQSRGFKCAEKTGDRIAEIEDVYESVYVQNHLRAMGLDYFLTGHYRDGNSADSIWKTMSGNAFCFAHWNIRPNVIGSRSPTLALLASRSSPTREWKAVHHGDVYEYICEKRNQCLDEPCKNGGTCDINTGNGNYICMCPRGYGGRSCDQLADVCDPNPCINGGMCLSTSSTTDFRCVCPAQFTGKTCEEDFNECKADFSAENYCSKPGGQCINTYGGYICHCLPNYTGTKCETHQPIRCSSANATCLNGAACVELTGGYACVCVDGFTGNNCEHDIDECESHPCRNGGTCVNRANSYECECVPSYTGVTCTIDVDECGSLGYCGNYACANTKGSYICDCPNGYTGFDCRTDIDECVTKVNPCHGNGNCVNTPGSHVCNCLDGYDRQSRCSRPTERTNQCAAQDAASGNWSSTVEESTSDEEDTDSQLFALGLAIFICAQVVLSMILAYTVCGLRREAVSSAKKHPIASQMSLNASPSAAGFRPTGKELMRQQQPSDMYMNESAMSVQRPMHRGHQRGGRHDDDMYDYY